MEQHPLIKSYIKQHATEYETDKGVKVQGFAAVAAAGLMVIQALAGLATIVGYFETKKWQAEVNAKLDVIIELAAAILQELEDLKHYIPIAIDDGFRKRITIEVNALKQDFGYIMAGIEDPKRIPKDTLARLQKLAADLRPQVNALRGYGYPGHVGVSVGLLTLLSIYDVAPVPKNELKAMLDDFVSWFEGAANPSVQGSFQAMANELRNRAAPTIAFVNTQCPRQGFLGWYEFTTGGDTLLNEGMIAHEPHPPRSRLFTVNLYRTWSGTFEAGLADGGMQKETLEGSRPNNRQWPGFPGCPTDRLGNRENDADARFYFNFWKPLHESTIASAKDLLAHADELQKQGEFVATLAPQYKAIFDKLLEKP